MHLERRGLPPHMEGHDASPFQAAARYPGRDRPCRGAPRGAGGCADAMSWRMRHIYGACVTSMADPAGPGQLPAPCNSMAPACMGALSCFSIVSLSGPQDATVQGLSWLPVAYWGDNHIIDGLSVDPALGPPIAI